MNYVIKEVCPDICEIISEENESPFFAVYSLEKVENKEAVISQIRVRELRYCSGLLYRRLLLMGINSRPLENILRTFL